MSHNFRSLRQWRGSQDQAFEELCYQFRDPTPEGAALVKTGSPDGSLEFLVEALADRSLPVLCKQYLKTPYMPAFSQTACRSKLPSKISPWTLARSCSFRVFIMVTY